MGEKGRVFVSGFWPKNRSKSIDLNCVSFYEKNRNKRGNNSYQRVKEIKIVRVRERERQYISIQVHLLLYFSSYVINYMQCFFFFIIYLHFFLQFISILLFIIFFGNLSHCYPSSLVYSILFCQNIPHSHYEFSHYCLIRLMC